MSIENYMKNEFKNYRKVTYPTAQQNRYLISEDGKLFDAINDKFVKYYIDKDGYHKVRMSGHQIFIHRLVAWEYCPNRDMKLVVDHLDANKINNHYKNLEWVTSAENTRRAQAMGLRDYCYGENNNKNKYPESLVREICELLQKGKTNMDIFYKISGKDKLDMKDEESKSLYLLIFRIRNKEHWIHISKEYTFPTNVIADKIFRIKKDSFFNETQVRRICELRCAGVRDISIMNELGFSVNDPIAKRCQERINAICHNRTWKYITKEYNLPQRREDINFDKMDDELINMLNKHYPESRIYYSFGPYYENREIDKKIHDHITEKIKLYRSMENIPSNEDIKI